MRKSFSWLALPLALALGACDDDSGSDGDNNRNGKLQVSTEVCPDEGAVVFVDGKGTYSGDASGFVDTPIAVPSGTRTVALWISGEKVFEGSVQIPSNGSVATITVMREVTCGGVDGGVVEPGEDGSVGDGDGDGDGDAAIGSDAGELDGSVVEPLEPCSSEDDTQDKAQPLAAGDREDALCSVTDVDFFKFTVGDDHQVTVRLSTKAEASDVEGQLTVLDGEGGELDVQTQSEGEDAVSTLTLFAGEYFVKVSDLAAPPEPDAGARSGAYTLSLAFAATAEEVEASAGSFHGGTNDDEVKGLVGTFVALSVHDDMDKPVSHKVEVRVTLPGAEPQNLVYDAATLGDGLLKVVFYDGVEPVLKAGNESILARLTFAGWQPRAISRLNGKVTKEALDGDVTIEFAGHPAITRTLDKSKLLALPTVTSATPSGDPTTLAVVSTRPAGATQVLADAFGADGAAKGSVTPAAGNFNIVLDGKLEDEEAFVVRVRAADQGLLKLPLPAVTNLSEFVYYSDENASEE